METVNKRVVSALTVVLVIFSITGVSFAGEYGVTPIYDYATEAICQLNISNGTAAAYSKVRGNYGTVTKVSASMYLEKYNNGKWPTVRTWSDSKNSNVFELSRTTSVTKGLYRVRTVFTVYSGSKSETITRYSSNVRYYFVKTADNEYQMVDKVTFDVKKFESYKAIEEYEIPQIILNDIASVAAYAEDMGCSDACVTLFIEKSNSLSKSTKPNTIARSKSVWQNKTFYHYQVYFTGLSTTWINLAMGGNTTEAALKSIKSLGFYVVGKATTTLGDVIDLFDVGKNCLDAWKAAKGTTPIYCNSENKVQAKLDYNLFFKYTFYYDPILKK